LPTTPITLSAEQIGDLNKKLSSLRHDVNNNLSLIVAAAEIMKLHPERAGNYLNDLAVKPHKIAESVSQFSVELEKTLQIRPG
jgi:hypothetical protein